MNPRSVLEVLGKDLKLGPRSPIFLYAMVFPIVATLVIQVIFGRLFEPAPRLGIVDRGDSAVTQEARDLDGVDVSVLRSVSQLKEQVEGNDLDAGLVLPDGFDEALRGGQAQAVQLFFGGDSLASNRMVLATTIGGLVRGVVGDPAPVEVVVDTLGDEEALPVSDRLIPLLVLFAMLIAGLFVPAASLVEEKEKGTLTALLITPVRIGEVVTAKGAMGFALAIAAGCVTLALNQAFGSSPVTLVVILTVAALMAVELGLVVGSVAKDSNTLFSVIKGGNILLMAPVIFFIWPDLPQWVPRLFPTYYFLKPLYDVALKGAGAGDVWRDLSVAAVVILLLVPVVALAGRRMEARLASG